MNHQESNFESPEEELSSGSTAFEIPLLFKGFVFSICATALLLCLYYFKKYLDTSPVLEAPSDLGLIPVILFCVTAVFLVLAPWAKMGLRVTKIAGIEFEKVVETQASEHAEEISYLQDRIEALEANIRKVDSTVEITENFHEPKLSELLVSFLTKYKQWSFSPSRIRVWGSQQKGFSALSSFEHQFIRSTLQKMVAEGLLENRISKKGNTLFRIE